MESTGRARRNFLTLILSSGVLALLWRFFTPRLPVQPVRATLSPAQIPVDGALVLRRARIAVIREADDIYALDLTCTHLGCTVTVTPQGLVCPCHGSRFDRKGQVMTGPADRPLRRLTLEENNGRLVVLG
jgi:Rieske Fe-S protein